LTFLAPDEGWESRARQGVGQTTDQLRTTTAELSAPQRSTVDTSDKSFTLDNLEVPIWGSRGREFKSRQPDLANGLVRRPICLPDWAGFKIIIIF
jgi:hypothetical protein